MYDFNGADQQQDYSDLIPGKTVTKMVMNVRAGKYGPEGILTLSNTSPAVYLDCEFIVSSGKHDKRKFWMLIMVDGVSEKAMNISRSLIRGILESARGIAPGDTSPNAMAARQIKGFSDLNGLQFIGKIGIDKGKDGYEDKNKLTIAVTPDMPEYKIIMTGGEIDGKPEPATKAKGSGSSFGTAVPGTPAWADPIPDAQAIAEMPQQQALPFDNSVPAWAR